MSFLAPPTLVFEISRFAGFFVLVPVPLLTLRPSGSLLGIVDHLPNVQGFMLVSGRLACDTKQGMPGVTRQAREALQQRTRVGEGAQVRKSTCYEAAILLRGLQTYF